MQTQPMITHDEMKERGFRMRDPGLILCAYDPAGDGDDRDAVVMVQREEWRRGELHDPDLAMEYFWRVLYAEYMDQNYRFSQKIARLLSLHRAMLKWRNQGKSAGHVFLIESNGVGYAAANVMDEKVSDVVRSYTTVAAKTDHSYQGGSLSMPRMAAMDHTRMLLDLERVKMIPKAPGSKELGQELNAIVWKGPNRPEALDGQHDDMFMAMTACCWFGAKAIPPLTKAVVVTPVGIHGTKDTGTHRVLH